MEDVAEQVETHPHQLCRHLCRTDHCLHRHLHLVEHAGDAVRQQLEPELDGGVQRQHRGLQC